MDLRRQPIEAAGWVVLGALLLLVLVGAVRLDRSRLPLQGDEATYAMQAASLAWDLDLAYTRADYDRFVAHWGQPPEGLVLQNRPGSPKLVYAKPPLYALLLAPFVRIAPVRGPVVANALLLAAAAVLTGLALRRRLGDAAPYWTAAFLFASVAFAYVFWGDADLFLLAAVASGLALVYWEDRRWVKGEIPAPQVYEGEDLEPARRALVRWLGAGALLAVAVIYRPVYLALFLPAVVAAWKTPIAQRRAAIGGLLLGAVAVVALSAGIQWSAGGDPTAYGGQRQGIYSRQGHEGYPAVDYAPERWTTEVKRQGNASWLQRQMLRPQLDLRLLGWNGVYALLGRNVGLLPYFLPLLLGFLAFERDRGRWALLLAAVAGTAAFVVLWPFNFYGGGALGNRWFLPLYPALWFMAARPARPVWAAVVALAASPFLAPLWNEPAAYPLGDDGQPRYVSEVARRWLPYETTQSNLPGTQVALGGGIWVKLLDHRVWHSGRGRGLRIAGAEGGDLLLGSPRPLHALEVELDGRAPSRLEVNGETFRPRMLLANGAEIFEVRPLTERAVHPLVWSGGADQYLYALRLRLPGARGEAVGLRIDPIKPIEPARDLIEKHRED